MRCDACDAPAFWAILGSTHPNTIFFVCTDHEIPSRWLVQIGRYRLMLLGLAQLLTSAYLRDVHEACVQRYIRVMNHCLLP